MSNDLFKRTGQSDFPKHLKVMVSGPPKSGKTSLLGTIPNMLVLDTEPDANNLESIAHLNVPYVTIRNSDDLRQVLFMLGDSTLRGQIASNYGLPDIGGVAIDTLDSLQKILKEERMKEQRTSQFLRDDWGWLKTEMEGIINAFTKLPMHVVFTMHTKSKEMGKGDDAYAIVLPGLEGSIAESIAGMVGYSLLSFRKEEIGADGAPFTKYWLKTEGDATHDFLGTRTAGRLPAVIEPNMKTIYDTVMASRPKQPPSAPIHQTTNPPAPAAATPAADASGQASESSQPSQSVPETSAPQQEVAQPEGQTAPQAEAPQTEEATTPADPATSAALPENDEPVNPAALGHVKKVYDALEQPFPEDKIKALTIGQARELVITWRALMRDEAEGKSPQGVSPTVQMMQVLQGHDLLAEASAPKEEAPAAQPKLGGSIQEAVAYVDAGGEGERLARVQEAYDYEIAQKIPRTTLISHLERAGAKVPVPTDIPNVDDEPDSAVTPAEQPADAVPTEGEALKAAVEGLGAEVISDQLAQDAPCSVCGKPIDDYDLAELGQKRFNQILCVEHYLAQQRK